MFVTAFMHGSGMHILNGIPDQDDLAAWTAITTWYRPAAISQTIIDHYLNQLDYLTLVGSSSTEASHYVNHFIICSTEVRKEK